MEYRITHTTRYIYSESVTLCQNITHLKPREHKRQHCTMSELVILPEPAITDARNDYFGNPSSYFIIQEAHRELTLSAAHCIEVYSVDHPEPAVTTPWELVRDSFTGQATAEMLDNYQYVFDSRYAQASNQLATYALESFTPGRPVLESGLHLTKRIHRDFVYDPEATSVATPVLEVFANRRGVCQDFAHLQIACLRSLGLAARYVSGYLSTLAPAGRPRLIGADATHAWVSLYCGSAGWVDLDPTNNQIPTDKYVLLAWGRDYDDVSPVKGVILGGGHHSVRVSVDVQPVEEFQPPLADEKSV